MIYLQLSDDGQHIRKFSHEPFAGGVEYQPFIPPAVPTHIEVEARVRYWEDASVNEVVDDDGTLIPFRVYDDWRPRIELATGKVVDWPEGIVASVHYKVCDEGQYWLADATGNRLFKYRGDYVPSEFLCHGDNGYGDYIILTIGGDGQIAEYERPEIDPEEWLPLPPTSAGVHLTCPT